MSVVLCGVIDGLMQKNPLVLKGGSGGGNTDTCAPTNVDRQADKQIDR